MATTPFLAPSRTCGGAGNDAFIVGWSDATLTGGGGQNTYAFYPAPDHQTTITDFRAKQDMMRVPATDWHPGRSGFTPDADGNAVLHFGWGATVTLLDVPVDRAVQHPRDFVRIYY